MVSSAVLPTTRELQSSVAGHRGGIKTPSAGASPIRNRAPGIRPAYFDSKARTGVETTQDNAWQPLACHLGRSICPGHTSEADQPKGPPEGGAAGIGRRDFAGATLLTEYGDLSSRPRTSRVWSSVLTGCGQALLPPKGRGLRVPHESTARTGFWHFEEGAVRAWSKASRCVGPVQVRCVSIISSAGATDASNRKSLSCGGRFHLRRKMKIANLRRTCGFMHLTGTPWALRTRPPVDKSVATMATYVLSSI
jgi:hypothetical protein